MRASRPAAWRSLSEASLGSLTNWRSLTRIRLRFGIATQALHGEARVPAHRWRRLTRCLSHTNATVAQLKPHALPSSIAGPGEGLMTSRRNTFSAAIGHVEGGQILQSNSLGSSAPPVERPPRTMATGEFQGGVGDRRCRAGRWRSRETSEANVIHRFALSPAPAVDTPPSSLVSGWRCQSAECRWRRSPLHATGIPSRHVGDVDVMPARPNGKNHSPNAEASQDAEVPRRPWLVRLAHKSRISQGHCAVRPRDSAYRACTLKRAAVSSGSDQDGITLWPLVRLASMSRCASAASASA